LPFVERREEYCDLRRVPVGDSYYRFLEDTEAMDLELIICFKAVIFVILNIEAYDLIFRI